jgi:hypothetical protein
MVITLSRKHGRNKLTGREKCNWDYKREKIDIARLLYQVVVLVILFYFYSLMVLGFDLRALCLRGKCSVSSYAPGPSACC